MHAHQNKLLFLFSSSPGLDKYQTRTVMEKTWKVMLGTQTLALGAQAVSKDLQDLLYKVTHWIEKLVEIDNKLLNHRWPKRTIRVCMDLRLS